jgi:hypothetical protein
MRIDKKMPLVDVKFETVQDRPILFEDKEVTKERKSTYELCARMTNK